jgi:hypothetical protein
MIDAGSLASVDGDSNYVRVQVLTNSGALDRQKQLAVVRKLTDIIAAAAGDPTLADRTWVLADGPDHGLQLHDSVGILPPSSPAGGMVHSGADGGPAAALARRLPGDRLARKPAPRCLVRAVANADRSQVSDLAVRAETFQSLSTPAPPAGCIARG